jgi:molybdopterin synthase catalytic subunit
VLRQVADEIAAKHGSIALAAVHRTGLLTIGDLSVVIAVAAEHRGEAIVAAHDLIDQVKARVPIWKRQTFADGAVAWVGIETRVDGGG